MTHITNFFVSQPNEYRSRISEYSREDAKAKMRVEDSLRRAGAHCPVSHRNIKFIKSGAGGPEFWLAEGKSGSYLWSHSRGAWVPIRDLVPASLTKAWENSQPKENTSDES